MPLIFIPFFFRTYSSSVHSLSLFRFGNSDERTQKKERRVHICDRVRVRVCSTYKSMNGRVSFTNLLCVFFVSIHINNIDDDSFRHSSAAFTCFVVFFLHSVLFRAIIFRNVQWLFYRSLIHRTSVCMKEEQKNIMRARGRRALTILYVFLCHSCLAKPANQHTHTYRHINKHSHSHTFDTAQTEVNTGLCVVVVALAIYTFWGCWLAYECIARQYRFEWARHHITPQRVKIHRSSVEIWIETATKMHFKVML